MSLWRRMGRWIWRPEEITFARWEMALMRLLFALVMFDAGSKVWVLATDGPSAVGGRWSDLGVIPRVSRFTGQPHPHGLALGLEKVGIRLTFLADERIGKLVHGCFLGALGAYVLGLAMPVALGVLFGVLLVHGTFLNSQGSIHHHLQLLTCVTGAQWVASVLALRRGRARSWLRLDAAAENRLANWTQQVIAAGYVVSALSKLWMSKGAWMWEVPRFGIQLAKAVDQDYYDSLSHSTEAHVWLPDWLLDHPWLARLIFAPALPLEFCAFLLLRNRALGSLYALALIGFHCSVSTLMSLDFRYNVQMMIVYFVNVPFWLWWGLRGRAGQTIQAAGSAAAPGVAGRSAS
jgi:hypothetical protein